MRKVVFVFLLTILISLNYLLPSQIQNVKATVKKWLESYVFKSNEEAIIQDYLSDPFKLSAKIWKIRYEGIRNEEETKTQFFTITMIRPKDNNKVFERIIPPINSMYYFEEEIFYGWERGFAEYEINIKSENYQWTVTIFEYADQQKEPVLSTKNLLDYDSKKKGRFSSFTCKPESGILKIEAILVKDSEDSALWFTVGSSPLWYHSLNEKNQILHIFPGDSVTFILIGKANSLRLKVDEIKRDKKLEVPIHLKNFYLFS